MVATIRVRRTVFPSLLLPSLLERTLSLIGQDERTHAFRVTGVKPASTGE